MGVELPLAPSGTSHNVLRVVLVVKWLVPSGAEFGWVIARAMAPLGMSSTYTSPLPLSSPRLATLDHMASYLSHTNVRKVGNPDV